MLTQGAHQFGGTFLECHLRIGPASGDYRLAEGINGSKTESSPGVWRLRV